MKNINQAKYYMAVLAVFFLFSCSDEENLGPKIDPQALEYVESFYAEAETRSIPPLDKSKLTLEFFDKLVTEDGTEYHGRGSVDRPEQYVEISQESWDSFNEYQREIFIYHELGHAVLKRRHLDLKFDTGSPFSLMHSNPFNIYKEETLYKKKYYLDELFTAKRNPAPDWSAEKENERLIFTDSISENTQWTLYSAGKNIPDPDAILGEITSFEKASGNHSLMLRSLQLLQADHYWRLEIPNPDITPGNGVEFRVKIKDENVNGNAFRIAIRGDNLSKEELRKFHNSKDLFPSFSEGFFEYNVQFDHFYSDVDTIVLFLYMQ